MIESDPGDFVQQPLWNFLSKSGSNTVHSTHLVTTSRATIPDLSKSSRASWLPGKWDR